MTKNNPYPLHWQGAEENNGIISFQMYDRLACWQIVESAGSAPGWHSASVQSDGSEGPAVVRREYRSAAALAPTSDSMLSRDFDQRVNEIVIPLINQAWRSDLKDHHDLHLVRYSPGDFYVPHADIVWGEHYRYFTVLSYLNDDFEGGGTGFPLLDLSVKPETGKTIIFPTNYLHCAEPVTNGVKYVLVSWITGAPPTS